MIKRSRLWTGKPPVGTPADYSNPINRVLIGWWQINEGGGTTLSDLSTTRKSASFVNDPTWGFGRAGVPTTLNFDGTNDGLSAPLDLSGTNKVSLSFWLKWTTFANNDDLAFEFTNNYNVKNGFIVDPNDSAGAFAFGTSDSTAKYWMDSFTRPSAGVWHHYVLTMDRGGTVNTAYVDGVLQALSTVVHTGAAGNFDNSTLYFMCRGGASLFGAGSLDNVRVYNRILSEREARSLYYEPDQGFFEKTIYLFAPPSGSTSYTLPADSGSIAITGTAASLKFNRSLSAGVGAFNITGTDAALKFNRVLVADGGSIAVTGTDATLTYSGAGAPTYTLTAEGGSVAITGTAASLKFNRLLACDAGSIVITGAAATLTYSGASGFTVDQLAYLDAKFAAVLAAIPSAATTATAVLAAAATTPIQADVRKVVGITVDGTGTDGDPWGPA